MLPRITAKDTVRAEPRMEMKARLSRYSELLRSISPSPARSATAHFRLRILTTRVYIALVFSVILFTSSRWEAKAPAIAELLFFFGVICVGIAALGRVWCSLYIAGRKDRQLVCEGPYSLTRNPLYFFSFVGIIGAGLATETMTIPLFFLATFSIYYPFVIGAEERKLAVLFPQEFPSYCQRVPRFFPKLAGFIEPESYTVNPSIVRRHMCSVVWFIWIVGFLEIIELLHERSILPVYWNVY